MNRPAVALHVVNALGWTVAAFFFVRWLLHR
jgi:hypothetical protein